MTPRERLRRILNIVVTACMLFNTLSPILVYAAPVPVSPAAPAPARVVPASDAVLGDRLLPGWMREPDAVDSSGAKSVSTVDVGVGLLPAWMEESYEAAAAPTSSVRRTSVPLGDELLPAWLIETENADSAMEGETSSDVSTFELDDVLLPAWMEESTSDLLAPNALLAPLAAGQCTPATDLDMQLTVPPDPVSRGDTDGEVFTVTVKNDGSVDTTEVSFLINPNQGFSYIGGTASATSDFDGSIDDSVFDPGSGTPNASVSITLTGATTATTLETGETITLTFRLATNANAKSGQLLAVSLQSGSPTPTTCETTQENVQTVRGNLVISKDPHEQDAGVGDTVTWTVTLRNTGLGDVYDAFFTDTEGIGLAGRAITPTRTPITLTPEASKTYTVTTVVTSCNNLTNTVAATWSIGNADGSATAGDPVGEKVDLVLLLDDPEVSVEVGSLAPPADYCGALDVTVPVTVANTGGAARRLRLSASTQNVNVTLDTGDWTQSGDTFTYTGGSPTTDTIRSGETITFTVQVTSSNVCAQEEASLDFTPIYKDACDLLEVTGTPNGSSVTQGSDAPTLNLTKAGPEVVEAGETFVYTVTVSGDNQDSITGTDGAGTDGIIITDVVPSALDINSVTVTRGTTNLIGSDTITWTLTTTDTNPTYSEELLINATVPTDTVCGAGGSFVNEVEAVGDVCPECELTDDASLLTYIEDFIGSANVFTKTASSVELCGPGSTQLITAALSIRNGITWTNSIYTDTLGAGKFAKPLNVVSGSTQVFIDGIERTNDVTITRVPSYTIDFSNVGTVSDTADITITYQVTATASSIVDDNPSQTEFVFSKFTFGGDPGTACDSGNTAFFGTNITLRRGDLTMSVTPETLNACRENDITLTVAGGSPDTLTDNIVVTFTAQAGDVFTPTSPTLGGEFAGETVTVTESPSGQAVTFTLPITFDLDSQGTISFPLFRNCGTEGPITASVGYQDRCDVPRSAQDTGGSTTLNSNLTLFTTPDELTLTEREARWRFYVSNGGSLTATKTLITNTLPAGHTFLTYTVNSGTAPQTTLDSVFVVTGPVNGGQVVTFTIPASPGLGVGERIRFDVTSTVESCLPETQVNIGLRQTCGEVDGVCANTQTGSVRFLPGDTSLLSSNNQTANLPLCETGLVELFVKNTSAASDEFDFEITELITNATFVTQTALVTVTDKNSNIVTGTTSGVQLQSIPFTPTLVTSTGVQTLTWVITDFVQGTAPYDVLAERDASDVIKITFELETGCAGTDAQVQSVGAARDVCNDLLTFEEDSVSLIVDSPELEIQKTGRNATTGSSLSELTNASAGDTVVWEIDVTNVGDQRVLNLFVTDTVPSNFTITDTNPMTTSQSGDTVAWEISATPALDVDETKTFVITGTVESVTCSLSTTNTAQANFACDTDDVCLAAPVSDEANLKTQPVLQVVRNVGDLSTCGGVITLTLENDGPPAQNVVLTDTLPTGFVFETTVFSTTAPSTFPVAGSSTPTWTWSTLPTDESTLAFRVRNSQTSGSCTDPGTSINNDVDIDYDDTCTNTGPYTDTDSSPIGVDSTALAVGKFPFKQVADVNDVVTWTIRVTNTGTGAAVAPNVLVTDVVGSNFDVVDASVGSFSGGSNTPVTTTSTVTWTPAITLPANDVWTAVVTATVLNSGVNTDTVDVSGSCGSGCIYTTTSDIAFTTLLA